MHDRMLAVAPGAQVLFALLALAAVALGVVAARAEARYFRAAGLGPCWWRLRLLMPLLFLAGGAGAALAARAWLGSDGLILAYLGVFVVALPSWFIAHAVAGRLLWPALGVARGLWLAASPLVLVWTLAMVGHTLQPLVWAMAMWFGPQA